MSDAISSNQNLVVIDAISEGGVSKAATDAIRRNAGQQKIVIEAIALGGGEALVYYSNQHYLFESIALNPLVRILMADAPPAVEKFRLIAVQDGVPQQEFDVLRSAPGTRFHTDRRDCRSGQNHHHRPSPLDNPVLAAAANVSYPRFSWDFFPQLRQELFDPDNPFAVQMLLGVDGKFELLPGLSLNAEVETSIYDNFNQRRGMRQRIAARPERLLEIFRPRQDGIGDLEADYHLRLAPDIFAVAKAGYLESMFAGVGGEVLWRPDGQRWALGGDLYEVWQRDFGRLFGLQSYHVLTGHISLYYASPWHDLNFALRAGRYLAGDDGVTLEITRRFSTGVEIGAFATKTNVPGRNSARAASTRESPSASR